MTLWHPTAPLATLQLRAQMLRVAREYFAASRALEVETPALSAAAVTDVHLASVAAQACGTRRFLHTSPEYPMKRLLASGCGDIYQIARVYRDGESGRHHNPEFTLIEWYRVGIDHHELMNDVEFFIGALLPADRSVDRAERLTYREATRIHAGIDALDASMDEIHAALKQHDVDIPTGLDRDGCLDLIMSVVVGPKLGHGQLTFVYDFPASQAALARIQGRVASRFEAYLDGIELANGFHDLANADEQRKRFEADNAERARRGLPVMPIDEHFLAALARGLPNCSGVALGFDRLVMCALGATHIDEVLAFPLARA